MAGKKRKARGTRSRSFNIRGQHHGDPVSLQIAVELRRVPKGLKITDKLLESMIRRKAASSAGKYDPKSDSVIGAKEGRDPKGIRLIITSWTNPGRSSKKLRKHRDYGSQADRWGSLWQIIINARIRVRRGR